MKFDEIDNNWILDEIEKIKYTLKLNEVVRYGLKRVELPQARTQSVSEHVCNMLILAHYFRDLEDPYLKMDFSKIIKMILVHDMGEIETGDIMMQNKNMQHKIAEAQAVKVVAQRAPKFISQTIENLCSEYESLETPEGKFVKAIDKLEQQFWHSVYCDPNMVCSVCTKEERDDNEIKRREIYKKCGFKFIEKFALTIHEQMKIKCPEYSSL